MWRESDLFGIYLPPLLLYMGVAFAIYAPLRWAAGRMRLFRWTWNPPLAEVATYICILGLLVTFL